MKLNRTVIAGLVAMSALTVSAISLAAPSYEIETVYFSDASHTKIVGEYDLYCTGKHTSWGTTSAYRITDKSPCGHGGSCSPIGCSQ
ncbi:MAG TPA: DUF6289 family protein [Frateuria sp.]|uniref:DUF6289 family protein n=1 Tax=Frateuria sp. TaxID=2211372 RepID=UPI002D7E99BF|nr:DUF6289 family protein [Frateuria sp.]HET6805298.1 DUF6289 family protein [Frateuria sp.]